MKQIWLSEYLAYCQRKFDLERVVATEVDRAIVLNDHQDFGSDLIGYVNVIHPRRLHLVGPGEIAWQQRVGDAEAERWLNEIVSHEPPGFIVGAGLTPPEVLRRVCEASQTPLMTTSKPCAAVMDTSRRYLSRVLAETTTAHSVCMDVFGIGVLIMGDSGAGKSELALELMSRGHGLVADDVTELKRIGYDILEASCSKLLNDYIEVRGLGLLNMRTIFGESVRRHKIRLRLVVQLVKALQGQEVDRLPLNESTATILGVPVRQVSLPVAAGRNLAVLLEMAVRVAILSMRGMDGTQEFIARHQSFMSDQTVTNDQYLDSAESEA